jgi:uronate dehydrogenase
VGFRPLDSSEPFRTEVEARQQRIDLRDPAAVFQGGGFVKMGPF